MYLTTSTLLVAAILLGSATAAIDASLLTQLPTCAQTPLISGIANSGCDVTDVDCICENADLLSTLQTAVKSACSTDDQEKTQQLTGQICPAVSSLPTTVPTAPTSEAATSEAAASTTTTTSAIMTDYPAVTTTALWSGTGTPTANLTATTGGYTAPTEPSVAPSTGVATRFHIGWVVSGMIGMGGIFVGF